MNNRGNAYAYSVKIIPNNFYLAVVTITVSISRY